MVIIIDKVVDLEEFKFEVSKTLTLLIEKKLIVAEGQGRGTRYLLTDIFRKLRSDISNSINKGDELHKQEDENSINNGENSINNWV